MQLSQLLSEPSTQKIRIVVFASGWNPKQEYDNALVTKLTQNGYKVDVVSYDTGEGDVAFNNNTNFKKAENVKRITINLLDKTTVQKVKKELNDNAKRYEHTVYIDGFGSDDRGKFYELYKDILTEEKGRTCLNWCTCCQAPQEYRQEPIRTPCNSVPTHIQNGKPPYIKYDADNRKHTKYDHNVKQWILYDGQLPESYKEHFDEYIANKKLNADFSPELVNEIFSKIQQQEKQNVSQLDMSNNSFVASENKHNISDVAQENKGWFHKAVGVPLVDYISCCKNNNDNYNMTL